MPAACWLVPSLPGSSFMGDSERDVRPGFCLACAFCGTTYPKMRKHPVWLVEAAEASLAGALGERELSARSGLTLQSSLCSSRCSCLERRKLVPKPLQLGFSQRSKTARPRDSGADFPSSHCFLIPLQLSLAAKQTVCSGTRL